MDVKEESTQIFADNLKSAMKKNELIAMDVARLVRVSPSTLSAIINRRSVTTIPVAATIASSMGLEWWWLGCPFFNPDANQKNISKLIEVAADLNEEQLGKVIAFAEFSKV